MKYTTSRILACLTAAVLCTGSLVGPAHAAGTATLDTAKGYIAP